ncbi:hypothetical protein DOY81_012618 [Sarcophaga bullata]|nr:hypothetical protein DOY81_012618 [Sarcophaga bullata]
MVTTFKPSTLLLPPGFDSQPVPRQPMLYPYAVAPPVPPTRPTLRTIKPITTADWVPVAISAKHDSPQIPSILASTRPIPLMEEAWFHWSHTAEANKSGQA